MDVIALLLLFAFAALLWLLIAAPEDIWAAIAERIRNPRPRPSVLAHQPDTPSTPARTRGDATGRDYGKGRWALCLDDEEVVGYDSAHEERARDALDRLSALLDEAVGGEDRGDR